MFLLSTLYIFHTFFNVSIADIEQVNVTWVKSVLVNSFAKKAGHITFSFIFVFSLKFKSTPLPN